MKIAEGLKVIQDGWIRKPKGFRVRFEQQTQEGLTQGFSPPLEDPPLNSDVTAWRYAWKLWQATREQADVEADGALYNITVVDDEERSIRFYGTGERVTYRPRK